MLSTVKNHCYEAYSLTCRGLTTALNSFKELVDFLAQKVNLVCNILFRETSNFVNWTASCGSYFFDSLFSNPTSLRTNAYAQKEFSGIPHTYLEPDNLSEIYNAYYSQDKKTLECLIDGTDFYNEDLLSDACQNMRTWEIQLFLKAAKSRAEKFIKENYPAVQQSIPDFLSFESENEGFKTAIARIKEFRGGRSTTLNLSNLNLTSLPEELFRLGNRLETIYLSHNMITRIPDGFKSLEGLKKVILSYNRISSVPSCMDSMPSLEKIDLTNNPIPFLSNHVIEIDSEGFPKQKITSSELKDRGWGYVKEIALNKFKDKIKLDSGIDYGGPSRIFTTEICESFMKHVNLTDKNKIPRLPESRQLDDFTLYALFLSKLYNLESIPLQPWQSKVNRTTGYHLHEDFFSVVKIFLRDDLRTQEKKDLFLDAYLKIHTDRRDNLVLIQFMRDPKNEEKKANAKNYLELLGETIEDHTDLIELSFSHFADLYLPTLAFSQGVGGSLKKTILNSQNDGKEILKNLQGETITAEKLIQKINFKDLPSRYSDALKEKIIQEDSDGESSSWVKDFVSFLTGNKTLPTKQIDLLVNSTRALSAHTCNMSLEIPESMVRGQAPWTPLDFIEALSSVIKGVSVNSV